MAVEQTGEIKRIGISTLHFNHTPFAHTFSLHSLKLNNTLTSTISLPFRRFKKKKKQARYEFW